MLADLFRLSKSVVALPVGGVFRFFQRRRTSSHAILEVTVERRLDVIEREQWLQSLRRAAADEAVEGVLFRIRSAPGGWAACQDLRAAIAVLARAGKATYAYVEAPTNATMWLAAACERVFAVPTGEVNLVGVGTEMMFFGQALENLGLQPDLEAAGAYKSFGEPFTRSFASAANLEATTELIDDLHDQLLSDIASDRDLGRDELDAIVAKAPLANVEAVVDGLIDQILYEDQLDTWLEEQHGERARKVDFDLWARMDHTSAWIDRWGQASDRVAVLHLQGPIVMDDKSPNLRIRARTVVPILRELKGDDAVAAVVLHVDSPGGDALASDLIWREVEQLKSKKPVVACFEDVSASGGFYLSAPATEIIARPATITGSIGVFGGKFVAQEGLRKVGVSTQAVLAAPNATLFSPSTRFTDAQRHRFKEKLQRFYDGFVHRVAAGRRKPEEAVEPHCRGRVWTGRQALENGLVDRLGALEDAIARARLLAGLAVDAPRTDHSGQPQLSLVQRWVRDARKEMLPAAAQLGVFGQLLDRWIDPDTASWLSVLLEHENRVLAVMPFQVRPR